MNLGLLPKRAPLAVVRRRLRRNPRTVRRLLLMRPARVMTTPRTREALVSWPIPGPFHLELNSPSSADLVAPLGAHLAKPEGRWGPGGSIADLAELCGFE